MRFKGFNGEKMEVRKSPDGGIGHDHLEILKDGNVQWYLHIRDNGITTFSGALNASNRPAIEIVGGIGSDMLSIRRLA